MQCGKQLAESKDQIPVTNAFKICAMKMKIAAVLQYRERLVSVLIYKSSVCFILWVLIGSTKVWNEKMKVY